MKTRVVQVSAESPDPSIISQAARTLREGGLVAFPTETVYGLGADVTNPDAVKKIFLSKGRPSDNPLIVHVSSFEAAKLFVEEIPSSVNTLAKRFWPGPMTLVLQSKPGVSSIVRAGLETVAVRVPNHPVALGLLKEFGGGIVAPSANRSGRPSPTRASHVLADLDGSVDLILDAGPTTIGVESTVIDATVSPVEILRQGGLTNEEIQHAIGQIHIGGGADRERRSPGTRYRHYAPNASVILVERGDATRMKIEIENMGSVSRAACIYSSSDVSKIVGKMPNAFYEPDPAALAGKLFDLFRSFDAAGVEKIFVEEPEESGIGSALLERLRKAAAK